MVYSSNSPWISANFTQSPSSVAGETVFTATTSTAFNQLAIVSTNTQSSTSSNTSTTSPNPSSSDLNITSQSGDTLIRTGGEKIELIITLLAIVFTIGLYFVVKSLDLKLIKLGYSKNDPARFFKD